MKRVTPFVTSATQRMGPDHVQNTGLNRKAFTMNVNSRLALLTIVLAASFAACSGSASPVPNANVSAEGPAMALSMDENAAAAKITIKPSSITVLVGKSANVSVSEKGYKGKLSSKASSACSRIASWTPASGKGPVLRVALKGKARGSCVLSFGDAAKHVARLKVTVETTSPTSSPSSSPSPAATLDPVPLFVSTGNTGTSVVQIPVGCTSSSCRTNVGGGFVQPEGLSFDASGNLYVADNSGGSILPLYEVPSGCTTPTCVVSIGGFPSSQAVTVDPSGNVYLAADNLYEIPQGCTTQPCVVTVVTGLQAPTQLASDASGNIYIADNYYGLFEYVKNSSPTSENNLTYVFSGPTSAVAIAHGSVYMAYNQTVMVGTLSCIAGGGGSGCFSPIGGGFFLPTGLAVDTSGDIYVADAGNQTVYGVPPGCLSQSCVVTLTPGAGVPGVFGIAVQSPASRATLRKTATHKATTPPLHP
jgi:NHL repeat